MRRDYFICIILLCICASLFFVCFLPLYFTYGAVIPREISLMESIFSWCFAVFVIAIIPIYSAVFKKFWFTAGLAVYGIFINIPDWILPGLATKITGDDASIISVVENYVLREIYGMANAPFAGMTPALGDEFCSGLSKWILPSSLICYCVVQLYRFYRDAYIADKLDPSRVVDSTAREHNREAAAQRQREASKADILGTVISAPAVKNGSTSVTRKVSETPVTTTPVRKSNPQISTDTKPVGQIPASSDTQVIHLGPPKNN